MTAAPAVGLSTAEFVGWTRLVDVHLPFPLDTGELPYIDAPAPGEVSRTLAERRLADSPVLAAALAAFAAPRLVVYAVRVQPDGTEERFVAVAPQDVDAATAGAALTGTEPLASAGTGVLVVVAGDRVELSPVADTELAAGVVGSLPVLTPLPVPEVEVTASAFQALTAAITAGASPRVVEAEMIRAGLPPGLWSIQQAAPPEGVVSGVLGAVGFTPGDTRQGRHATRSAGWREFDGGALLEAQRGVRRGEEITAVSGASPESLFRAAADAVASIPAGDVVTGPARGTTSA